MMQLTIDADVRRKIRPLAEAAAGLNGGGLADAMDPKALHIALNAFNRARLQPCIPGDDWEAELRFMRAAELIEARFIEEERAATQEQISDMPTEPAAFVEWFEDLKETGPGQFDPFFDYLAKEASREEFQYFIRQEYCGEIGFDDLIAMTQVRFPEEAKLELARNFWDEQGCGKRDQIHGPMYVAMAHELGIRDTPDTEFLWESLAVANLLTGLACNRRYAWHSLGAMGLIEMTSTTRASRIAEGLERIGCSDTACAYFRLHTTLDVEHWNEWREHVLIPLITETPGLMRPLAEGAFLRLNAGTRLIERYRGEMGLNSRLPPGRNPRNQAGRRPC